MMSQEQITTQCKRYAEMLTPVAERALSLARQSPVRVQAEGYSLNLGIELGEAVLRQEVTDATREALGELFAAFTAIDTESAEPHLPRFNDVIGFSRTVYGPVLLRMALQLIQDHPNELATFNEPLNIAMQNVLCCLPLSAVLTDEHQLTAPPEALTSSNQLSGEGFALVLWQLLCTNTATPSTADPMQWLSEHYRTEGPLHTQTLDDQMDHWTYRELVGMHALHHLAIQKQATDSTAAQAIRKRLDEALDHHQAITQPDYTTYQPWAIAAFLSRPETIMFGEQQLHDATTHLHLESGTGALVISLLMADAVSLLRREQLISA